jgi:hypothetical protein
VRLAARTRGVTPLPFLVYEVVPGAFELLLAVILPLVPTSPPGPSGTDRSEPRPTSWAY